MPRGRGAGGVVAHGGKIYYAGGLHDGGRLPGSTSTTRHGHVVSAARHAARAGSLPGRRRGRRLYAIGGRQGPRERACRDRPLRLRDASWEREPRTVSHAARRVCRRGARGARSSSSAARRRARALRTVEAYDPRSDAGGRSTRCQPPGTGSRPRCTAAGSLSRQAARPPAGATRSPPSRLRTRHEAPVARLGRCGRGSLLVVGCVAHQPDVTPVGTRRPPLRLAAERANQGIHGRPARAGRLPGHGDRSHRRDPVHPEPRRRRILGHGLRRHDARALAEAHFMSARSRCSRWPRLASSPLRSRRHHLRLSVARRRPRVVVGEPGAVRSRVARVVLPLGVESAAGRWGRASPLSDCAGRAARRSRGDVVYVGGGMRQPGSDLVSTDVFFASTPSGRRIAGCRRCPAASTTPAGSPRAETSMSSAATATGCRPARSSGTRHAPARGSRCRRWRFARGSPAATATGDGSTSRAAASETRGATSR